MQNIDPKTSRIYGRARELLIVADAICRQLPSSQRSLRDQLTRSSESVVNNFVEGCGRRSPDDRANFFCIAKGSAQECAASIDIALIRKLIPGELAASGIDAADHVAAMLSRWR